VLAQQLLFAHTEVGDLTPFIDGYFDTRIGKKGEAESYRKIAKDLDLPTHDILFISDVWAELNAASQTGMKTLMSIRPGNEPQPQYSSIRSFDEIS
jgi:enolase-phosphatase E1